MLPETGISVVTGAELASGRRVGHCGAPFVGGIGHGRAQRLGVEQQTQLVVLGRFAGIDGCHAGAALGLSAGGVALLRAAVAPEAQPGWGLLPRMLVEAALTGLLAPLLQVAFRRVDGLFGEEEPDLIG